MASIVDIYNLALTHIGAAASVASPTEASVEAKYCSRFYPQVIDQVLVEGAWSFATRRIVAAPVDMPAAVDGWRFAYQHPTDALQILSVLAPGQQDERTRPFVIEADAAGAMVILTNVEQATLRYIERVQDPSRYPTGFVAAAALLLASHLAGLIRKDPAAASALQQQYLMAASIAKGSDARGQAGDQDERRRFVPPWIAARRGAQPRIVLWNDDNSGVF